MRNVRIRPRIRLKAQPLSSEVTDRVSLAAVGSLKHVPPLPGQLASHHAVLARFCHAHARLFQLHARDFILSQAISSDTIK